MAAKESLFLEYALLHEANHLQAVIIKRVIAVTDTIIMTLSAEVNTIAYLIIYDVEFFAKAKMQSFHSFIVIMFIFELVPVEVKVVNQVAYEEEDIFSGFDRV